MRNKDFIAELIIENSDRPRLPGEVWKFDALEAHVMHGILEALVRDGLISEENGTVKPLLETFRVVNYAYGLAQSDLDDVTGVEITPCEEDIGFFTSLVPFFKLYVELDYTKTEKIRELSRDAAGADEGENPTACACSEDGCGSKDDLPCGHSLRMHLTILEGWYEREILAGEMFVASRRAVQMAPPEERYHGKLILARYDAERMVEKRVQRDMEQGLYSPELTEELTHSIMESTGQSRRDAEKLVVGMRANLEDEARKNLWELLEENARIIDTEKRNVSE